MTPPPHPETDARRWRIRIVFTLWATYATYYFGRVNLSIAVPELERLPGMDKVTVGWTMTALFIAYGVGQLVHGLLIDRYGARGIATAGMLVSAACNACFALVATPALFIAAWAVNGFAQATGAPARIKTLGAWVPTHARGRSMAILGTDYMVGNALTWLVCGALIEAYDWRAVFLVPAGVLVLSAMHFAWRVRNEPADVGLPDPDTGERNVVRAPPRFAHFTRKSLFSWKVWIVACAYFGVDLFRYGFLGWSFSYLVEGGASVGVSQDVFKIVMMPAAGALGVLASGWLSDRMSGRRVPIVCTMLVIAAALAAILRFVPRGTSEPGDVVATFVLLGGIGFFLYGPHLIMGATLAIDLGGRDASASASGVIDAMGYAGAAVAGVGTAYAHRAWGWDGAFVLWISAAVGAALLMALLWRMRPEPNEPS